MSYGQAFARNFLGSSPNWYKLAIVIFLIINPIIFYFNPFIAGWVLVVEFIFTLAMALKCYPLQPGGILTIEAVVIGMTSPEHVLAEVISNFEVILLLVFMVAGIYFIKDLLLLLFTKIITKIRSKAVVAFLFCFSSAFLSAFLDALTVVAVVIAITVGFYSIYHKVASGKNFGDKHDHTVEDSSTTICSEELESFRAFLRNILMHSAVGTAIGGVCTMVGEPQNLIIASNMDWSFAEFALRMAPVTLPIAILGFLTCYLLERFKLFGYGAILPDVIHKILVESALHEDEHRTQQDRVKLICQALIGIWLIVALAFHMASVGMIGLSVIVLATALTGITNEHALGKAFEESLPFTALLVVFFAVVGVIIDQKLFVPVIEWALSFDDNHRATIFYIANGLLSSVSDNVFVGTVYINEAKTAFLNGNLNREQLDLLAVAINTGTNLPSVATPNGQAAFLFLLTSAIAPLVNLSYGRMMWMALPYTIVLTLSGLGIIHFGILKDITDYFYDNGMITHHTAVAVDAIKAVTGH